MSDEKDTGTGTLAAGGIRILITGGNGLIGRYAKDVLLESGCDVHIVSRSADVASGNDRVTVHAGDILNHDSMAKVIRKVRPTHLLHLAWETTHGAFWSAPENLDWVAATMSMARTFADNGGQRLVSAGTCAEYDWRCSEIETGNCCEATSPIAPIHLYGIAKDATRRILESYAANAGFEFAWGRVFMLFDPAENERRFVKSIITNLKAGKRAPCSSGAQLRDFMHANDVGAAFAALLLSDVTGPVNIASGKALTLAEIAATIGELMERPDLIGLGDLPNRPGEPARIVADIERLAIEVGFRPSASLKTRLVDCIENTA